MSLIVVYNPVCGDGTAKAFFTETVLPLLEQHQQKLDHTVETEYAGHAGDALADFLLKGSDLETTVVLGSGDGTLHEIINRLSTVKPPSGQFLPKINFVLVPCGTANALFYSLFPPNDSATLSDPSLRTRSLQAFLTSRETIPLTLAISTLSGPPAAKQRRKVTVSTVVTSTSLHAAILNDSEHLRSEHPGIERFKIAARQNSTKWYQASVKLLPISGIGVVQLYDPTSQTFKDHPLSSSDDPIVDLEGPFMYFLSTVNVDRLESAFRIAPLARTLPPARASCELVIVRPSRDPSNDEQDTPEAREAFVPKIWSVLGGAYDNGSHVGALYNEDGSISHDGSGIPVVEYVRCGGWEWIPVGVDGYVPPRNLMPGISKDESDPGAHILCSDGAILHIEEGGRVVCVAATPQDQAGFAVYAEGIQEKLVE